MQLKGQFSFPGSPRQAVWDSLTTAERIAECLPGCEQLRQISGDTYAMEIRIGIGAIRGSYRGTIRLDNLNAPSDYGISVNGSGTGGFVNGSGTVKLSGNSAGTVLEYSGHVSVGGPIAAVGQRMVGGAARMVIDQFFRCVANRINPQA